MANEEKKRRIQADYDQTANHYDVRYESIQDQKLKLLFTRLKTPSGLLFDDGAGTGLLWDFLIKTANLTTILKPPQQKELNSTSSSQRKQDEEEGGLTWGDLAKWLLFENTRLTAEKKIEEQRQEEAVKVEQTEIHGQVSYDNYADPEDFDENINFNPEFETFPDSDTTYKSTIEKISPEIISQLPSKCDWHMIGMDLSFGMLQVFKEKLNLAKQRSKQMNLPVLTEYANATHLICGDAEHLPFRENSFNMLVAITTLQNLAHLESGLEELKRVKQAQAKLGITFLKKSLSKEELLTKMKNYFGYPIIISPNLENKEIELEDWITYC